jgi:hypothetical protein
MISKDLTFTYDLNYNDLYNLTLEENDEFIKVIPEIVYYEKGIWKNNKRIDKIMINITDIPYDLRIIIDMMRNKQGFIKIKIKFYKEIIDNKIIINTKLKLYGVIGTLINNAINLNSNIELINDNDIITNVNVNYQIKSLLFNDLNERINFHIQQKLENYYIKNINQFLIEKKL